MFTRPEDLGDDEVREAVATGWGLEVVAVEQAPVGFGSHHWWVTTADGCRWFATADDLRSRRLGTDEPVAASLSRLRAALVTAAALRESGLDWVVAPRRTDRREVVLRVGEAYALSLYPRVAGHTFGWGPFDDPAHRAAVLDRLVALHTTSGCREVVATDDLGDALVADLRALLDDPVLVDWDTCLLAPRERDLWMLVGEDPGILGAYAAGTGTVLDPRLLEACRLRWDLADVESCVRDLRASHTENEDTRTAWDAVRAVLDPDSLP